MMDRNRAGFREIEHTADWALEVWAPDLAELFASAARGMYWLMGTDTGVSPRKIRSVALDGADAESLLVAFLSELLYLLETEALVFDRFDISVLPPRLSAQLSGLPAAGQKKEIKAVTYHNLRISNTEQGYVVTIVFDV